jgi:hypothetical protein
MFNMSTNTSLLHRTLAFGALVLAALPASADGRNDRSGDAHEDTFGFREYATNGSGGGSAPKVVETEADAVKLAAETPGAIAIADAAATGELAILAN